MHEYNRTVLWKHDIRPAGQLRTTQPIPQASGMEALAYKHLQLCIRTTYPRHLRGPLLRGEAVNQGQPLAFFLAGLAGFEAAS